MSYNKNINILGVKISQLNQKEIIEYIKIALDSKHQNFIITPNPEILLKAHKDNEYCSILNSADLAIPDGFGLSCAALAMGKKIYRYPGADFLQDLLQIAQDKESRVLILNWSKSLSNDADIKTAIKKLFPRLDFSVVGIEYESSQDVKNIFEISNADVLITNFGAPGQERFIYYNINKFLNIKIAIGVGGALDFITKKISRSPKIFQVFGMEWLWRLIQEPKRYKRIYSAVIIFPLKFIFWRILMFFK